MYITGRLYLEQWPGIDIAGMNAIMHEKQLLKQILLLRLDMLAREYREWLGGLQGICTVQYSKELVERDRETSQSFHNRKQEIIDQFRELEDDYKIESITNIDKLECIWCGKIPDKLYSFGDLHGYFCNRKCFDEYYH